MPDTESRTADWLSTRQRYRRLMVATIVAAVALNLVVRFTGYPVVAELAYVLGIGALLPVMFGTDITLFDERERAIERRAGVTTLNIVAAVLIAGAVAVRLLSHLTALTVPTVVSGALYGYIAMFMLYGVLCLWYRYTR